MLNISWRQSDLLLSSFNLMSAKYANINLNKFINCEISDLLPDGRGGMNSK